MPDTSCVGADSDVPPGHRGSHPSEFSEAASHSPFTSCSNDRLGRGQIRSRSEKSLGEILERSVIGPEKVEEIAGVDRLDQEIELMTLFARLAHEVIYSGLS